MQQLAGKLAALDPEAGAALHVISYFDTLVDGHVGLETLVRGAAVLSGSSARFVDPERHLVLRVQPDGRTVAPTEAPDDAWASITVLEGEPATAWLETSEPGPVDALVLERLAAGVRAVWDRTRGRVVRDDGAALEVLVDLDGPLELRARAARRLGWAADAVVTVVALRPDDPAAPGPLLGGAHVLLEPPPGSPAARPAGRAGIGGAVPVVEAGRSWQQARAALRFTAAGTPDDPGPRTVAYAALGGLALLADVVGPATPRSPDVLDLDRAATTAPWALTTLEGVAGSVSLRAASVVGHVHHSTLQARLTHLEESLGWSVSDPQGRLRLQLALALRRLHATA